ncbi:MAG: crotonase/enoyl-CoA hydratase family protein [Paracoccaceae bacterium]|nr:crotonase/enoyl-CoA hydratase family protein [Paracoccaceae bacterium]
MFETIRVEVDARGVAGLWLNRPEKHNVMSGRMMAELNAAALDLGADPAVRVVVLQSGGESFCAGGDLGWMQAQVAGDAASRRVEARKLAGALFTLNTMPKPMIGRIHGNAFGGGVGMACVCDIAIAAEGAKFGLTETKLGLIPATIGPYVIARMGEANARRVMMSSRVFDAAEAGRLGVVARVVPLADLDAAIEAEVAPYLDCAPGAVAAAKRLARRLGPVIDDALIDETIEALVARWETDEAAEGIAAFFAKRKPVWRG